MDYFVKLLIDNPLLLLFVVAAIGYPLGRIRVGGTSLGVAAVLFVGIAIGALHPDLKLPDAFYSLGLALFVYTVGLSGGPAFFASFRHKGLRDNLIVFAILVGAAGLAALAHALLQIKGTLAVGMFVGSLNNTAALAGVLEYIKNYVPQALREQMMSEPVIGFSITFPMGVVGTILAINIMQRIWKIDYAHEAREAQRAGGHGGQELTNRTIRVAHEQAIAVTIDELIHGQRWDVIFGRIKRGSRFVLLDGSQRLELGDLVSAVGSVEDLDHAAQFLGEPCDERLDLDRSEFDYRRVFVSNPAVAGRRLRELRLPQRLGAVVTRLRRGDMEFIPRGDTVLVLGDRVRVVTRRENLGAVSAFFGDSYRALSEIDVLTFSFGLALGLLLGAIPIPLPGGIVVKLGLAGGPLIVALILGALGRTGPMVWNIPYSANLVLRQFGLVLFLAAVGTRAGYGFISTLLQGAGLTIFLAGAVITVASSMLMLWIGYRVLKIPFGLLTGVLAGLQTQPAALSFALEQSGDDLPNTGYASIYPTALIAKILLAQILLVMWL
jgi:putative transport protein